MSGLVPETSPSSTGGSPEQIRHACGFDQVSFGNGTAGNGAGATIAIVDAYDDPNTANDLHQFDFDADGRNSQDRRRLFGRIQLSGFHVFVDRANDLSCVDYNYSRLFRHIGHRRATVTLKAIVGVVRPGNGTPMAGWGAAKVTFMDGHSTLVGSNLVSRHRREFSRCFDGVQSE